nr:uncharacterized protein LOC112285647 isoform X1 [Physcomitrium patens]XP_024382386.1 uncharacterized protein LOC112285647 isoform X1 [Physcomitrium patens]|eukprot:XP_024382385.1 uncharacterized protein LOC112285647 isoform X1 [Physcomitrella patens]
MTWIPYAIEVFGGHGSSVVKSAEKVLLSEMWSIRRHSPPAGLQHIIIVLTSGLSLPPLYFPFSGVEEFLLTLGNHASLVRRRRRRGPFQRVDLVLSPVDITPVFQSDLVLSPADNSLAIPHNKPVHPCVAPEQYNGSAPSRTVKGVVHSSPANGQDVSLSQSPLSRGLHNDEAHLKLHGLQCRGSLRECVALPLNWRYKLHLTYLSSYRGDLARRRWEWWSGISSSIEMVTGILIHVICSLLTPDLLFHLMIDTRLTYKALNAIKYIDKLEFFQHVTSGDICNYLKTFFSKIIQNRQEWQRIDGSSSGASLENALPLATSIIPPYEQQPSALQQYAVHNVQPLARFTTMLYEPRSSVSQQNGSPRLPNISKQKVKRRRSDILQQNIYLGRFLASQQNSNWRKLDVSPMEANQAKSDVLQQNANHGWVEYPSQENVPKGEDGGVRRTREVTEAASQVRSKTHSLGPALGVTSQHPESKPTIM